MKKRIYISAPINGYDLQERKHFFQAMEDIIKAVGHTPVSPMKNGLSLDAPYEEHMKRDLELLRTCDVVVFCGDFGASVGCRRELEEAQNLYKTMLFNPKLDEIYNL